VDDISQEILVDLYSVEFLDSFGVAYLAACLDRCQAQTGITKILIRPPSRANVNQHLQDTGFYESIGLGNQFQARKPNKDRVDLVHLLTSEPLFIDCLLNFWKVPSHSLQA
jgi:anti-anti-sigma regulatory factor